MDQTSSDDTIGAPPNKKRKLLNASPALSASSQNSNSLTPQPQIIGIQDITSNQPSTKLVKTL